MKNLLLVVALTITSLSNSQVKEMEGSWVNFRFADFLCVYQKTNWDKTYHGNNTRADHFY